MNIRKYVIINQCFPILFMGSFEHVAFKEIGKITSAGFFDVDKNGKVNIFGMFNSLNLASAENDSKIIERFLYT